MKLQLEINSKAISDPTRKLEKHGILMCPPIGEDFWLMRVKVSDDQAVVAFPKFGVIGIGFQKEVDWNTNLPSGSGTIEIYEHIKHNRAGAQRQRCIDAIRMIQEAAITIERNQCIDEAKQARNGTERATSSEAKLRVACKFLRRSGHHELAEALGH